MMLQWSRLLLIAIAIVGTSQFASAQGPFYGYGYGNQFGYNSFQNRLPTPPYFSVYPPVYYGQRYARPYGDSPFAAMPQLQASPDYHAVPREVPFRARSVVNPHVQSLPPKSQVAVSDESNLDSPRIGKPQIVVNPFVHDRYVTGNPLSQ